MKRIVVYFASVCLIGGTVIISCKKDVVVPIITTTEISGITINSFSTGGNITKDGGATITSRGVCYGTSSGPTVSDLITTDGDGPGSFDSKITGLTSNTLYYVRAYATNSAGTAYGNEVSATTVTLSLPGLTTSPVTAITMTSAVSGGNITSSGNDSITARGVCWATTTGPTILNNKTTDGAGVGIYTSNLTGLQSAVTYFVRAYATNSGGTAYGNELTFKTAGVPVLTTVPVTLITSASAVSGGNISDDGGANITARGVCWSTSANPTTTDARTTNGTGKGIYASNLTGLLPSTLYHIRAYATNVNGTAYGNDISFTTSSLGMASVTTSIVTADLTTAVTGGNISSDGGAPVTARGVCWSLTANPTVTDSKTSNGTGTGTFVSNLTGLSNGTAYYLRAYATNSQGTAYGNQIVFSTKIADIEGNTYKTVLIGTQLWTAENLKSTKLNDNTPIPIVTDNTLWSTGTTPAYCWYANDGPTNKPLYGAIYNFYTVATGNLCPAGWHVPSEAEYETLEVSLGMDAAEANLYDWRGTDQGAQMKSTTGWAAGQGGTNTSGWSALPGGYRYAVTGVFNNIGTLSYWWTSSSDPVNALYRRLDGTNSGTGLVENRVFKGGVVYQGGKYVRCVK